jgi:hypothetical protein
MDGPDTAPPMTGTHRPALAHRCGHIKALYHSQVKQISVRPRNLGTSWLWFGFLSLIINYIMYSFHTPLQRKPQAALPTSRADYYFRNKPFRLQTSPTSCSHEIYRTQRVQPSLNMSQCHCQNRHVAVQSASRVSS